MPNISIGILYEYGGPGDIIGDKPGVGACDWDLERAIDIALNESSAQACLDLARTYSWQACTEQFVNNLVVYNG